MRMNQVDKLENCYFVKNILMSMVVLYHSIAIWIPGGWFVPPEESSYMLGIVALWLNFFHI